jgi:hypothetical protein
MRSGASARNSTNSRPGIKPPQRIDVMSLPTYSEATKMTTDIPPNYLDLYGSNRSSRNSEQIT